MVKSRDMQQILNPRVDFAFKKLFGTESNKDLLMGLLNAILLEEDQLSDLTLKNPYTTKNGVTDKLSIFDIRAVDMNGRQFSIEMQISSELGYEKRALYLWSKLYSEQLMDGVKYSELKKSISIHLLNFDLLNETDYHNTYAVLNLSSKERAFSDFQLHTVELNKFEKQHPVGERLVTALDRWSTFLTRAGELARGTMSPEMENDPLIKKAIEVLKSTALSEDEQEDYRTHWQWMMSEHSSIEYAKHEGKIEGKIEIAQALKESGMSLVDIQKFTGLSIEEIG